MGYPVTFGVEQGDDGRWHVTSTSYINPNPQRCGIRFVKGYDHPTKPLAEAQARQMQKDYDACD